MQFLKVSKKSFWSSGAICMLSEYYAINCFSNSEFLHAFSFHLLLVAHMRIYMCLEHPGIV
jgi:hypothetical protein